MPPVVSGSGRRIPHPGTARRPRRRPPGCARRAPPACGPGDPARARERGRAGRVADRRHLGRAAAGDRRERGPGLRLAAAQAAGPRRDRDARPRLRRDRGVRCARPARFERDADAGRPGTRPAGPPRRPRRSAARWHCGAGRPCPTSRTCPACGRSRPGSTSSGWLRSSAGSTPTSTAAAQPRRPPSSIRSSPRTHCASGCEPSDARALPQRAAGRRACGVPGRAATLVEELGFEPGAELQALERAILQQDPALSPPGRAPAARATTTVLAAALDVAALPVLAALGGPLAGGRDGELLLASTVGRRGSSPAVGRAARARARSSPRPASPPARRRSPRSRRGWTSPGSPASRMPTCCWSTRPRACSRTGGCSRCSIRRRATSPSSSRPPRPAGRGVRAVLRRRARLGRRRARRPARQSLDRTLRLAGASTGAAGRDASRLLASASLALQRAAGVHAEPVIVDPSPAALVAARRRRGGGRGGPDGPLAAGRPRPRADRARGRRPRPDAARAPRPATERTRRPRR